MQPLWPQGCPLGGENATLALNHLAQSCCASPWEGFPHNMKPDPSRWACCCVSPMVGDSISPLPLLSCRRPVLICQFSPCGKRPQLGATLLADTCWNIWISWIPSLHCGVRGNPESFRCDQCRATKERPCTPQTSDVGLDIDISLHAYQTSLRVSRPQSSRLIGKRYNAARACLWETE